MRGHLEWLIDAMQSSDLRNRSCVGMTSRQGKRCLSRSYLEVTKCDFMMYIGDGIWVKRYDTYFTESEADITALSKARNELLEGVPGICTDKERV
jgi:hypothetical protein